MTTRKLSAFNIIIIMLLFTVGCKNKTPSQDYVKTDLLLHTLDSALKKEVVQFNDKFKNYRAAQNRALRIDCVYIYNDSIIYHVGYNAGINHPLTIVFCEPIDGKQVLFNMYGCIDAIRLDPKRSVELLKNTAPIIEYNTHIKDMSTPIIIEGDTSYEETDFMFEFVGLQLVFDRNHNLIKRDTMGYY